MSGFTDLMFEDGFDDPENYMDHLMDDATRGENGMYEVSSWHNEKVKPIEVSPQPAHFEILLKVIAYEIYKCYGIIDEVNITSIINDKPPNRYPHVVLSNNDLTLHSNYPQYDKTVIALFSKTEAEFKEIQKHYNKLILELRKRKESKQGDSCADSPYEDDLYSELQDTAGFLRDTKSELFTMYQYLIDDVVIKEFIARYIAGDLNSVDFGKEYTLPISGDIGSEFMRTFRISPQLFNGFINYINSEIKSGGSFELNWLTRSPFSNSILRLMKEDVNGFIQAMRLFFKGKVDGYDTKSEYSGDYLRKLSYNDEIIKYFIYIKYPSCYKPINDYSWYYTLKFGKYKGCSVYNVVLNDPGYVFWLVLKTDIYFDELIWYLMHYSDTLMDESQKWIQNIFNNDKIHEKFPEIGWEEALSYLPKTTSLNLGEFHEEFSDVKYNIRMCNGFNSLKGYDKDLFDLCVSINYYKIEASRLLEGLNTHDYR